MMASYITYSSARSIVAQYLCRVINIGRFNKAIWLWQYRSILSNFLNGTVGIMASYLAHTCELT